MKNVIIIDGTDVYIQYGVMGCKGLIEALFSAPSRRKPYEVNWQDRSGVSVDLSNPIYEARSMALPLGIMNDMNGAKLKEFRKRLEMKRSFLLKCPVIDVEADVDFENFDNVMVSRDFTTFAMLLTEQNPYSKIGGISYMNPIWGDSGSKCGLMIDGVDVGRYGIQVKSVSGLYDIVKNKDRFRAKFVNMSGVEILDTGYSLQSTEQSIKLQITGTSLLNLRNRYVSFVKEELMADEERILSFKETGTMKAKFYYESADLSGLFVGSDGRCVADINLNIVVYGYKSL